MSKTTEELSEAELFCDVDETFHVENLSLQDEPQDEYEEESQAAQDENEECRDEECERQSSDEEEDIADYETLFYGNKVHINDENCYAQNSGRQNYTQKRQALEKCEKKVDLTMKYDKENYKRTRIKDKSDRATVDQVLDERTRYILLKLVNNNFLSEISGCVATGKEANVYYALAPEGKEFAVKVYRTSVLIFSNRNEYVTGDHRFRHVRPMSNPRKMIPTWAEKEIRNLTRMHNKGLPVPEPLLQRNNVLVMKFLGNDGWASPKLKDVQLNESKARVVYREVVTLMWKIYNDCKLVHADLSEFNMLYHQGTVYIIDVSQSVERDHPKALEFLRQDCTNVTNFFKFKGVAILSVKELFDFITDISITTSNMDQCLDALSEQAAHKVEATNEEQVVEEVFKREYIPQRLTHVIDAERDINAAKSGVLAGLNYGKLAGLKADLSGTVQQPDMLESNKEDANSSKRGPNEESASEKTEKCIVNPARPKHETKDEKHDRKKVVKEAQAARRKEKKEHKLEEKKKHTQKKSSCDRKFENTFQNCQFLDSNRTPDERDRRKLPQFRG